MRENGIPLTRANYLKQWYGDPNFDIDSEEENDMPAQFRQLIGPDSQ
jgi:hypothetical protein